MHLRSRASMQNLDNVTDSESPPSPKSTTRWLRPNIVLGKIFVPILALLAYKGIPLVVYEYGYQHLMVAEQRTIYAVIFLAVFVFSVTLLLLSFYYTWAHGRFHSKPPHTPSAKVSDKTTIYKCTASGDIPKCFQGDCNGSWTGSAMTRHCADCGVCKIGHDHHCPFLDSCITQKLTFKPFLIFLISVIPAVGWAVVHLIPIQIQMVRRVYEATWTSDYLFEVWWDHWYSWLLGPVNRYVIALYFGYQEYPRVHPPPEDFRPLSYPNFVSLLVVFGGFSVTIMAIAMLRAIHTTTIKQGLTAVQSVRIKRWKKMLKKQKACDSGTENDWDPRVYFWVPVYVTAGLVEEPYTDSSVTLPASSNIAGVIVAVNPDIPLYDFGPQANWKRIMGEHWIYWLCPWVIPELDDLELGSEAKKYLQREARKQLMEQQ